MKRIIDDRMNRAPACESVCAGRVGAGPRPAISHRTPDGADLSRQTPPLPESQRADLRPAPTDLHSLIQKRNAFRFLMLAAVAVLSTGCMRARQLEALGDEIADQCPGAHFSREFSISLGPMSLALARFATGFSEDTREARQYLSGVSRVQLAMYEVGSVNLREKLRLPRQLHEMLEEDGWEMAVRTTDRNDAAWILYREEDGVIRDLHITSFDKHELVMIRVSGSLNDLFDKAMKDTGKLTSKVRSKVLGKRDADSTDSGD